ncbi:hypothetical protein [Mangrovimonas cancribranchiae]|uniref:DUF1737 domain-containing protein n=1 Tax=Mangrovimonas cancribranchiae TaxID=3080055 RepID=A0AAU6PBJ0_9FLAO
MEYLVLREIHLGYLIEAVNKHIEKGWKPQGGVNACRDKWGAGNNEIAYLQALIK